MISKPQLYISTQYQAKKTPRGVSLPRFNKHYINKLFRKIKWEILKSHLEKVELQVYPLSFKYIFNFIISYTRRWREILVYMQALFYLKKGFKIYDVEEKILSND